MPPPPPAEQAVEQQPMTDTTKAPPAPPTDNAKTVTPVDTTAKQPPPSPPSMNKPTPTGNFSVQVGAFSDPDKAERAAALARQRFTNNVYRFFIKETNLFKIYVGDFMAKDEARKFRDRIAQQYPEDYKDAWVAPIPYEQK